jgi:hypothetical protein
MHDYQSPNHVDSRSELSHRRERADLAKYAYLLAKEHAKRYPSASRIETYLANIARIKSNLA